MCIFQNSSICARELQVHSADLPLQSDVFLVICITFKPELIQNRIRGSWLATCPISKPIMARHIIEPLCQPKKKSHRRTPTAPLHHLSPRHRRHIAPIVVNTPPSRYITNPLLFITRKPVNTHKRRRRNNTKRSDEGFLSYRHSSLAQKIMAVNGNLVLLTYFTLNMGIRAPRTYHDENYDRVEASRKFQASFT